MSLILTVPVEFLPMLLGSTVLRLSGKTIPRGKKAAVTVCAGEVYPISERDAFEKWTKYHEPLMLSEQHIHPWIGGQCALVSPLRRVSFDEVIRTAREMFPRGFQFSECRPKNFITQDMTRDDVLPDEVRSLFQRLTEGLRGSYFESAAMVVG